MAWLLLLTTPTFLVFVYRHPRYWIARDVAAFQQNGARDTKKKTFHRQRWLVRAGSTLVAAVLSVLPLWGRWPAAWVLLVSQLIVAGGYWIWYFNPGLSEARKLDYVGRYHVSWSAEAARYPDRWLWRKAWAIVRTSADPAEPPTYPEPRCVAKAAELLEDHLDKVWRYSLLGYLAGLVGTLGLVVWD